MDSISNKLKNLRESKNYKQNYVASFLGISQQNYSRYENGKREIPVHFLHLLAKLYSVSVDYILGISITKKDYENISQNIYNGKTLNEIIDDISSLNNENMISLLKYIEFLKYTQKTKEDK